MSHKFENHALHESISGAMKSLRIAYKYAKTAKDIEALILISERWMALIQKIDDLENDKGKSFGFIGLDDLKEMHDDK